MHKLFGHRKSEQQSVKPIRKNIPIRILINFTLKYLECKNKNNFFLEKSLRKYTQTSCSTDILPFNVTKLAGMSWKEGECKKLNCNQRHTLLPIDTLIIKKATGYG